MEGDVGTPPPIPAVDEETDSSEDNSVSVCCRTESSLNIRTTFLAVLIVIAAVVLLRGIPNFKRTNPQDIYSVVFDAGSTGSRVFVFHFKARGIVVSLENEVFQSVEPGISFYAHSPEEARQSLQPLLQTAIDSVPMHHYPRTLVIFKATAGLRLLSKTKADQIINVVRKLLLSSPFHLPDPKSVEIMSGEEEGLFGWITVNFLLDLIWNAVHENTVTTFDLGGGSVQISFEISHLEALRNFLVKDVIKVSLLNSEFNVFTKSYLGYGLKSARLGIMGGKEGPDGSVVYDPDVSDQVDGGVLLLSTCFTTGTNFTFVHSDVFYIVKGQNSRHSVLLQCRDIVDDFVQAAGFIKSSEMSEREIHLFSYFFDVAMWAKLIPWSDHIYVLTPQDFYNAAIKYCNEDNFSQKHPFLCIDLLYVHSLLTLGAGLTPDKKLTVEAQLLGREVSWALGAALSNLSEEFSISQVL